jgi:hypothetical protein
MFTGHFTLCKMNGQCRRGETISSLIEEVPRPTFDKLKTPAAIVAIVNTNIQ